MDLNNFCYLGDQFKFNSGNVIINSKYYDVSINHTDLIQHIVNVIGESIKISNIHFNKNTFIVNVDLSHFELEHLNKELIIKLVNILENLFPEKLEICYIKGASGIFKNMYRYCISIFLNNRTKSKVRFYKKDGSLSKSDYYIDNNQNSINTQTTS